MLEENGWELAPSQCLSLSDACRVPSCFVTVVRQDGLCGLRVDYAESKFLRLPLAGERLLLVQDSMGAREQLSILQVCLTLMTSSSRRTASHSRVSTFVTSSLSTLVPVQTRATGKDATEVLLEAPDAQGSPWTFQVTHVPATVGGPVSPTYQEHTPGSQIRRASKQFDISASLAMGLKSKYGFATMLSRLAGLRLFPLTCPEVYYTHTAF